jgi:ribonucleoside-diphosphate reductase alpha chain
MFSDNVKRGLPECYVKNGLDVKNSQLCNEIYLYNDADHTYVCCLSSVNAARFDEWANDPQFLKDCIYFLDAVMEEFIVKAQHIDGFEKAVRFSRKSRALGLGVLGWHTLLQSKMIPFDSFAAMRLNARIFRTLDQQTLEASRELAKLKGVPEWCIDTRNTHRIAVAPTLSNSLISGGVSQGIEPIVANYFGQKSAKGTFIRKNPTLVAMLEGRGLNTPEIWEQINKDSGSVRNVKQLSPEEKEVFLTAREINQHAIVKQAVQRQRWIDQGQSVNLFFSPSAVVTEEDRRNLGAYIHDVHMAAWQGGLKGLYYVRSESVLSGAGGPVYRSSDECKACEG